MPSQNAVEIAPRNLRVSLRRLLGLHEHTYGGWVDQWAAPQAAGKMMLLSMRECALCQRAEFRRSVVDVPASGFPHELHINMVRSRD